MTPQEESEKTRREVDLIGSIIALFFFFVL